MGIASDMRPNSYSQQNTLRLREIFGTNTLACEMDMEAVNLQLGNSTEQWAPPHSGQEYKTANAHLKIKNKKGILHTAPSSTLPMRTLQAPRSQARQPEANAPAEISDAVAPTHTHRHTQRDGRITLATSPSTRSDRNPSKSLDFS